MFNFVECVGGVLLHLGEVFGLLDVSYVLDSTSSFLPSSSSSCFLEAVS